MKKTKLLKYLIPVLVLAVLIHSLGYMAFLLGLLALIMLALILAES